MCDGVEVQVPREVIDLGVFHIYGGEVRPPGSEAVADRILARYVTPGAETLKHGLVPIAELQLPRGSIVADIVDAGLDEIEVLPFRFPAYQNNTYGMKVAKNLFAIVRNMMLEQISTGTLVVVQLNENRHWDYFFGRLRSRSKSHASVETMSGEVLHINAGELQFIGKVTHWFMDGVDSEIWIENDDQGNPHAMLGKKVDHEAVAEVAARKAAYRTN